MGRPFYELNIYKKGLELLMIIYKVTATYPKDERFDLISQTRSSANSILAIISEAHGRYYFADKTRVMYQARGETEEVRSHLLVAQRLNYISEEQYTELDGEYSGLGKGINAYIKYLIEQKGKTDH